MGPARHRDWHGAILARGTRTSGAENPSGAPVREIQEHLVTLGYLPKWKADGVFGSGTRQAVSAFQSHMGITSTGIVDSGTWLALLSMAAGEHASPGFHALTTAVPHGEHVAEAGPQASSPPVWRELRPPIELVRGRRYFGRLEVPSIATHGMIQSKFAENGFSDVHVYMNAPMTPPASPPGAQGLHGPFADGVWSRPNSTEPLDSHVKQVWALISEPSYVASAPHGGAGPGAGPGAIPVAGPGADPGPGPNKTPGSISGLSDLVSYVPPGGWAPWLFGSAAVLLFFGLGSVFFAPAAALAAASARKGMR